MPRRFLLNAFAPALAFVGGLLSIFVSTRVGFTSALTWWDNLKPTVQLLTFLSFLGVIYLIAGILESQWINIVRLFEGYRGPIRWARQVGVRWHTYRLDELLKGPLGPRYMDYGKRGEALLPTRLGNILRSMELYPKYRYKIKHSVVAWPRLYLLLPDGVREALAEARAGLEFLLVISLLSATFAVVSFAYLVFISAAAWAILLSLWGGMLLAISC